MKIQLALLAAFGSALVGTTLAEQPSTQPMVLAALRSTCSSESAAASAALGAGRHDAGTLHLVKADVERLQEYLSFHADAVQGNGIADVLPWQELRATAN